MTVSNKTNHKPHRLFALLVYKRLKLSVLEIPFQSQFSLSFWYYAIKSALSIATKITPIRRLLLLIFHWFKPHRSRENDEKMAQVDHVAALFWGVEYEYFSALARYDQDGDSDSNIDSIESLDPAILEEDSCCTHSDSNSESTDSTECAPQPSSSNTRPLPQLQLVNELAGCYVNLTQSTKDCLCLTCKAGAWWYNTRKAVSHHHFFTVYEHSLLLLPVLMVSYFRKRALDRFSCIDAISMSKATGDLIFCFDRRSIWPIWLNWIALSAIPAVGFQTTEASSFSCIACCRWLCEINRERESSWPLQAEDLMRMHEGTFWYDCTYQVSFHHSTPLPPLPLPLLLPSFASPSLPSTYLMLLS